MKCVSIKEGVFSLRVLSEFSLLCIPEGQKSARFYHQKYFFRLRNFLRRSFFLYAPKLINCENFSNLFFPLWQKTTAILFLWIFASLSALPQYQMRDICAKSAEKEFYFYENDTRLDFCECAIHVARLARLALLALLALQTLQTLLRNTIICMSVINSRAHTPLILGFYLFSFSH